MAVTNVGFSTLTSEVLFKLNSLPKKSVAISYRLGSGRDNSKLQPAYFELLLLLHIILITVTVRITVQIIRITVIFYR